MPNTNEATKKNACQRELDQEIREGLTNPAHEFMINDTYDDLFGVQHEHSLVPSNGWKKSPTESCSGTSIYPIIYNTLLNATTVNTLTLSPFRERSAAWITDVINKNAAITAISYEGENPLLKTDLDSQSRFVSSEKEATFILAEALKTNTSLKKLTVHRHISLEEEESLLEMLKFNKGLTSLSLERGNPIAEREGEKLAQALSMNTTLESCTIRSYRFDTQGMTAFAVMLKKNVSLKNLYLGQAEVASELDLMKLRDALIQNTHLTSVKLPFLYLVGKIPFRPLEPQIAKAFVEIAKLNPMIQELQISLTSEELKQELQTYLDRNRAIAQCHDPVAKQQMLNEVYTLNKQSPNMTQPNGFGLYNQSKFKEGETMDRVNSGMQLR